VVLREGLWSSKDVLDYRLDDSDSALASVRVLVMMVESREASACFPHALRRAFQPASCRMRQAECQKVLHKLQNWTGSFVVQSHTVQESLR
jgi:hypothetical protein